MELSIKSLKIETFLKIPVILVSVLIIVAILAVIIKYSESSNSNDIEKQFLETKSSNPEGVIPPVETGSNKKERELYKVCELFKCYKYRKCPA